MLIGPTPKSFNGSAGGTTVTVDAGTYHLTESGGPATDDVTFGQACNAAGQVVLAPGEAKTCTLVNNDQPPAAAAGRLRAAPSTSSLDPTRSTTRPARSNISC